MKHALYRWLMYGLRPVIEHLIGRKILIKDGRRLELGRYPHRGHLRREFEDTMYLHWSRNLRHWNEALASLRSPHYIIAQDETADFSWYDYESTVKRWRKKKLDNPPRGE